MPKLPVPVPPADDIADDLDSDERFLFAVPARRARWAETSLRGVTQLWLEGGNEAASGAPALAA